ncbi:RHS repeat domain-containing protein [Paenimyroides aestuarii]|uniref:RHS repeat-associated core domain-containing protein n=1 Tax=Paenimyroides aestuarii TaxID=2968490 RepID=A0ABY5NT85_9FLAO|nr:RHS repeat-associated core domain-containing protein [Paenimyroides aestuarii]UUV21786.1 RHS repeat-associated core domain-containing protein [Paenimyroides aestuarii]
MCTPIDENNPGNVPVDPTDPTLTPGQQQQADCLTDLNILVAQLAVQIQNGEGSAFFEWYQCINVCIERNDIIDSYGCWERFIHGDGEWPSNCNVVFEQCDCEEQPIIGEIDLCPVLAMIYIDTHLLPDLSNACEVLNYVEETYKCVPLPSDPIDEPITPEDEDDDWVDGGGNTEDPGEDYDEELRKPIWWYHTDHLGSSTYLTDNFGRPSHYYETLPFGEMIVEHNQSTYNGGKYNNAYKFNGKELDDATQMYYYDARYYNPRISIFVSVDPLAEQTMTPYQYVHNNPIMFTDPTGMSAEESGEGCGDGNEDKITVNRQGIVTNVVENDETNTFFDEDGNELKYNDVNDSPLLIKEFKKGDRLYNLISKVVVSNVMKDAGEIKYKDSFFGKVAFSAKYLKASYYEYDFSFSFFQHHFRISDISMSELLWGSGFVNSVPFIRFQGSNTLYNVPDAGNFMWGHRGFLNGAPLDFLLDAANKNEGGSDTTGDQAAITAGYKYRTK